MPQPNAAEPNMVDVLQSHLLKNDPNFRKFAEDQIKTGKFVPDAAQGKQDAGTPQAGVPSAGNEKSIFFGNNKEIKGLDTKEKFDSFVKEKFSIDTAKGYDTLANSITQFRTQAQKASELEKKQKGIENAYKTLPPAIKLSIDAYSNGRDFKQAFFNAASKLDYSQDVTAYNKEDLAAHYFKEDFESLKKDLTDEKIKPDAYAKQLNVLHQASVKSFNSEKKEFVAAKDEYIRTQELNQTLIQNAAEKAVANLKSKFPKFVDEKVEDIKSQLLEGRLHSLFFDEDGIPKEDAATKLAMAMYGEEELISAVSNVVKDAKTEAVLDIVEGANKKPPLGTSGGANTSEVPKETQALLDIIGGGDNKNVY